MKIWYGYGSEHSMNLVMIGRFKNAQDASEAKQLIDQLKSQVEAAINVGAMEVGKPSERFNDAMLELLSKAQLYNIGPTELEQFVYDVTVQVRGDQMVITTEEIEVIAFLKVMLDKGARVEVYSAHDYPGTGYGRGE